MMGFDVPILLIVFNREDTVVKVLARLREIQPEKLFIAADGPRLGKEGEREKCELVRQTVLKKIDWPCEVKTLFRNENLGCGKGPSTAITWFFEHVEEGIILEDDIVPSKSFFEFAKSLLKLYRSDSSVWHIGGNCYNPHKLNHTYYFSAYPHVWGWATWRRAWKNFRFEITDIKPEVLRNNIDAFFLTKGEKNYWMNFFQHYSVKENKNAWDFQWTLRMWYNNGKAILPAVNLITNVGFGEDATHTLDKNSWLSRLNANEIRIPSEIEPAQRNKKADLVTSRKVFHIRSTGGRLLNSVKTRIKSILKTF